MAWKYLSFMNSEGKLRLIDHKERVEIFVWCKLNCDGRFKINVYGVSFETDDDLCLAKLTFGLIYDRP